MRTHRSWKAERDEEVDADTYWERRGRERGPPSRNPQRSARCWTWWRLQRRQHSDRTPAWEARRGSTLGVDQTLETERSRRERRSKVFNNCHKLWSFCAVSLKRSFPSLFPLDSLDFLVSGGSVGHWVRSELKPRRPAHFFTLFP